MPKKKRGQGAFQRALTPHDVSVHSHDCHFIGKSALGKVRHLSRPCDVERYDEKTCEGITWAGAHYWLLDKPDPMPSESTVGPCGPPNPNITAIGLRTPGLYHVECWECGSDYMELNIADGKAFYCCDDCGIFGLHWLSYGAPKKH